MIRLVLILLVLAACSSGGDDDAGTLETREPTTADSDAWLDQWEPFTKVVTEEGQQVGLMEDDRMLYTYDCDLAEKLTAPGGKYGPGPRDPETQEFEPGYGTICGSH